MFSPDDTIVAIATPPGRGGIGVVRISGPRAQEIACALCHRDAPFQPRHATFTRIRTDDFDAGNGALDEVIVTSFPAPRSYTGQDVVEISAHGSPVLLTAIVRGATIAGARLAERGEFTLRGFLNGKRDLVQAEAVRDLIEAATTAQARVAFDQLEGTLTGRIADIDAVLFDLIARLEASLDFPDEGYHFVQPGEIAGAIERLISAIDRLLAEGERGRVIREGATVVVAGRANVGKSSIFNRLAGGDRAIVTDVPGTTRDLIAERIDVAGIPVTVIDTAGIRESLDLIEREGISRGARAREVADLVLVVVDGSEPLTRDDEALLAVTSERPRLVVINKGDRPIMIDRELMGSSLVPVVVSALTGEGFSVLSHAIAHRLTGHEPSREPVAISNVRHIALLEDSREHLRQAHSAALGDMPEEIVLTDLQGARRCFDDLVGTRTSEDVLRHIFASFCIGK